MASFMVDFIDIELLIQNQPLTRSEPFEDEMSHSVPDSARSVPWLVGGGAEPRNGKGA